MFELLTRLPKPPDPGVGPYVMIEERVSGRAG